MLVLLDLTELEALFEYKNRRSALRAISRGTFPVKVYKIGKGWYAKRDDVRAYFKSIATTKKVPGAHSRRKTFRNREEQEAINDAVAEPIL
jgi:hypothetical protein